MTEPVSHNAARLRVGICISLFWPTESGAERQARRQARELVQRGHSVTVYTRHFPGQAAIEKYDRITIRRCIRTLSLGPMFGATYLASLAGNLWRDRQQLDVIHCHQAAWEAVAAGWIHQHTGVPTLVQPAAGGPYGEVRIMSQVRGRRWVRAQLLRNSYFVAISEQIERELLEFGVPRDKLARIASGVDTDQFAPARSPDELSMAHKPNALFLGRLHPQKNLEILIRAWQLVHQQVPDARLVLVGDGPQRQLLEQKVDELNLKTTVRFVGPVSDPLAHLQAADLFVLPSISEGMSNSLLEAMACAVPAVVSSAGGNVDLIEHETRGLVADATSPQDLAAQLTRMFMDPVLRARCGAAARQHVVDNYSLVSVVDRYETLYRQLCRNRHVVADD